MISLGYSGAENNLILGFFISSITPVSLDSTGEFNLLDKEKSTGPQSKVKC